MRSHTTERFRRLFERLPKRVQREAREAYKLFAQNPNHPGLHFKRIHKTEPLYSVRIDRDYRAVGLYEDDEITWDWIGSHADYDHLLSRYN